MTAQPADALAETFKENAVLRVAIVDDGYDKPEITAISEQDWLAFTTAVDEADDDLGPHKEALHKIGALPTYGDLRIEQVHDLWTHHSSMTVRTGKDKADDSPIGQALSKAFASFSGRKMQKLQQLGHVEQLAERATGVAPQMFSSAVSPAELQGFDLVFLDFFLGDEVDQNGGVSLDMLNAAETRACKLVKEVAEQVSPNPAPLFVVISSLASNDNVPAFRDKAMLLSSKFRFLSKSDIEKDPGRRDFVLRSLVKQRAAGNAVELLTRDWQASIQKALGDMMESIRRLDIADYAYIKDYRLTEEKVSLLNYLTWLYNSYLGSFVEERLSLTTPDAMGALTALVSKSAILRPMSEVPRIYSRITTTKITEIDGGQSAKVSTGDIFVRKGRLAKYAEAVTAPQAVESASPPPDGPAVEASALSPQDPANAKPVAALPIAESASSPFAAAAVEASPVASHEPADAKPVVAAPAAEASQMPSGDPDMVAKSEVVAQKKPETDLPPLPDVVATVTPVCDLVPGRIKAKNIILVGGELTELAKAKEASNHLLVYERQGAAKPVEFQIKWDSKSPVSFPIGVFDGEGIKGTDYVRVTRLRELYAAEIAQALTADLARVGVPIAPPFTRALDVVVRAAKVKSPILSTVGAADRPFAWDVIKKKTGSAREVVFSEEFLWALAGAVKAKCPADGPCGELISVLANLEDLLVPFDSNRKNPTKAGEKVVVKMYDEPGESLHPSNKELLAISLFAAQEH
ncbi:hypothetical protein [Mesorhizobium sp. M00.F.Ca.ET.217.01.1.1]|uniref:hypothetical protein n=1 Tax=Mesorhizobium sp. M00.F.Ca.ET.217.01.1.1 TaxID=2500529 RepID=UPI000FDC5474|nr:hypothetical protein [Mesorhizobium sp. M00.F.Ca.ET.217.01.1.1]TGQ19070.1 hypothetical protein EN860_021615 [Mesorhizobium sp. M00.F.Ca.ET.217.01.1.1]TGV89958.1 hypothetical protein EN801_019940 [Mesorhizobium sp. M00.F.Ca.ET.158.01.1.1]